MRSSTWAVRATRTRGTSSGSGTRNISVRCPSDADAAAGPSPVRPPACRNGTHAAANDSKLNAGGRTGDGPRHFGGPRPHSVRGFDERLAGQALDGAQVDFPG